MAASSSRSARVPSGSGSRQRIRARGAQPPVESYASIGEDLKDLKAEYLVANNLGHWSQQALSTQFDAGGDLRKWASNIRAKLKRADLEPIQVDCLVPRGGHLAIDLPPENIQIDG